MWYIVSQMSSQNRIQRRKNPGNQIQVLLWQSSSVSTGSVAETMYHQNMRWVEEKGKGKILRSKKEKKRFLDLENL